MSEELVVKEKDVVGSLVNKMKGEWAKVLPSVCTPERFARVALSCIRKNPKLAQAISTPEGEVSLCAALMRCAELGIEPDGERAYLIPYGKEVQFQLGYKGLAELIMRTNLVSKIHTDKVCKNDIFEYDKGDIKQHKIDLFSERGEIGGYYCIIKFKDGTEQCDVMSKKEIDEVRKISKSPDGIPWKSNYSEMARKVVFKRCAKWIKQSPEVSRAIEIDNEDYIDINAEHVATSFKPQSKLKVFNRQIEEVKSPTAETASDFDKYFEDKDVSANVMREFMRARGCNVDDPSYMDLDAVKEAFEWKAEQLEKLENK